MLNTIATPKHYRLRNGVYVLTGNFKAYPGSVTTDPVKGAQQYNDYLLDPRRYEKKRVTSTRIRSTLERFKSNRRVITVTLFLGLAESHLPLSKLSKIENYLFWKAFTAVD